jgi:hypothetical protein
MWEIGKYIMFNEEQINEKALIVLIDQSSNLLDSLIMMKSDIM